MNAPFIEVDASINQKKNQAQKQNQAAGFDPRKMAEHRAVRTAVGVTCFSSGLPPICRPACRMMEKTDYFHKDLWKKMSTLFVDGFVWGKKRRQGWAIRSTFDHAILVLTILNNIIYCIDVLWVRRRWPSRSILFQISRMPSKKDLERSVSCDRPGWAFTRAHGGVFGFNGSRSVAAAVPRIAPIWDRFADRSPPGD